MIIIKDTSKSTVLENIEVERTFLRGIQDTLSSISSSPAAVTNDIYDYIKSNAVLNGISEHAKRNISDKHSFLEVLAFCTKTGLAVLDFVEDNFKKSKVEIYDTSLLTYKQRGLFNYISTINFFSNFTSKILDIILTQPKTIQELLTKANVEFINKTVSYYNILLTRFSGSLKELKRAIDILSDEVYDAENSSIIAQVKGKEVVSANLVPHELNPKYWVKYAQMKKDVSRIKKNRGEIDICAMKLQKLGNKKRHTEDPTLDRQIEYWTNKIQILDAEIARTEAKYA